MVNRPSKRESFSKMFYQHQIGPIQGLFQQKIIKHNGTPYDGLLFAEKSEVAKSQFRNQDIIEISDRISEHVFENFYYLAVGQPIPVLRMADFIPYFIKYANEWQCSGVLLEIERQILESPDPELIIQLLCQSPNSFPRVYEFVHNNLEAFKANNLFYDLSVSSLGRIFYPKRDPPVLHGKKTQESIMQLIQKKKEFDKKIEEKKMAEAARVEQVREVKKKNEYFINEKNKLHAQKISIERQNNQIRQKIEEKQNQIKQIEEQTQKDVRYADELRNQIQRLKREIEKKEQNRRERREMRLRTRRWRR
ncbi:hypothetical protein TRFO_07978 [Tritrichomonas foetus]|uniref:Uncharacterized protein n=1 Tax=Tritrichomonas foetus TaxID=1144522 RepID=A0A1J4JNM5_9EUKA|nr:hypothetical protein TRFO_07978 [Tritrichomonas foetus]|eukprot:OHT00314.1 hypothetical protein TRFO_07978 [Tritrichomonas foetus]